MIWGTQQFKVLPGPPSYPDPKAIKHVVDVLEKQLMEAQKIEGFCHFQMAYKMMFKNTYNN